MFIDLFKYTDDSDDTLTVTHDPLVYNGTFICVMIENEDEEAFVWLTKEQAVEAAQAILGAVGAASAAAAPETDAGDLNEALLRLAAAHGVTAHFRYAKTPTSPIEIRSLLVSKVEEMGGRMVATGYDQDRDEPRAYRVDRIKGTVELS